MQKQEGEWEHSSLTSSGNAACLFFTLSCGRCVSTLVQGWEGSGGNQALLHFPLDPFETCCSPSRKSTQGVIARAVPNTQELQLQFPHWEALLQSFAFSSLLNTASHLFLERNYQFSFDSTMIAQSFMVFLIKVDARLNITKVSLFGHYGKTSWVSLGLLMALNSFLTMNRGQISDKNSSHLGELQPWCVVQMGRQAVTAETCLTYS